VFGWLAAPLGRVVASITDTTEVILESIEVGLAFRLLGNLEILNIQNMTLNSRSTEEEKKRCILG
jgi:hypothetical protein